MDLPPAVSASASSSAAHLLPQSTSTTAGRNSSSPSSSHSSLAGLGGQTGPRSSISALGSAPPPSLQAPITSSGKCAHKDVTRCSLHRGECCSCGDNRPHEQYYERYIDGGIVLDAPRWAHYCSACKDYWDRLNASVPSYRDNQPRLTAWDLFHVFGSQNPPQNPTISVPNFTHSDPTTSRHSLTSPAQAAVPVATSEDGFPSSYAVFQHMSPNFSNEYHPVVAQHIRTWGELETRIADEPRYSPEFESLLRQYYTARYKAKRMTELDRQSRGGSLSIQARDEYFQLLNAPGPFDMPIPSGSRSGGNGNGSHENSGSDRGNSGSGGGGVGGGAGIGGSGINGGGGSLAGHSLQHQHQHSHPHQHHQHHQHHQYPHSHQQQPQHQLPHQAQHPNLAQIGISFGRAATFGSFLQSASSAQTTSHPRTHGNTISHQPSSTPTTATDDNRPTLGGVSLFTSTGTNSASTSPYRSSHRRRGSTPADNMLTARINAQTDNSSRPAPVIDRERERDRDRETGRITAGTSPSAADISAAASNRERPSIIRSLAAQVRLSAGDATTPNSESRLPVFSSRAAATTSSAGAAVTSSDSERLPPFGPPSSGPSLFGSSAAAGGATSSNSETWPSIFGHPAATTSSAGAATSSSSPSPSSSSGSSHSLPAALPHGPYPIPTEIAEISDFRRSRTRPRSSNSTANLFTRSNGTRRPISSVMPDIETERTAADRRRQLRERNESEWENQRPLSASSPSGSNTNRTSVDSTIVDTVMSDLPSSQNSDISNRTSNSASEPGRVDTEPHNSLRHRPYFHGPPTSDPWNTSLLPGESSRNELNDPSVTAPYRRDGSSNPSTNTPQNTMSGSPITSIAPFVFPANRRTLRPTLLDQTTSPPAQSPPESSTARNGLASPANRVPANIFTSLPHLPAPLFSPPRTLSRPRGGSISNNGNNNNNNANHNRQNSNGSDGFPATRRERMNPLTQPLGTRADPERESYESPARNLFSSNPEERRQYEETVRRFERERLQELRQERNYELLQRSNLQRQTQQNQADLPSESRSHTAGPQGRHANWPGHSQSPSNSNNIHARSPDHASAHSFTVVAEDDPSSASEGDYEDLIPLDDTLNDDDQLFATLVDGYLSRVPHESVNRRRARLLGLSGDDLGHLPGSSQSYNRASENDVRERFRARRMRDRDVETRYRHNEAIRDIASLVTSARESGVMGFPHRWSRESGLGSNPSGRNTNNNSSQTTRTLDHPERPGNMKEEDLKIMADCKVCYGQIADMVLLPCAHLALCQWCAETVAPAAPNRPEGVVTPRSNCPVCRARVERKIKVFRC